MKFETYTGKKIDLVNIKPEDICLEDIAQSLSYICRANGHVDNFYSVAEHSIFVGLKSLSLHGLFHDAAEAYTSDIPTPIKSLYPDLKKFEKHVFDNIQKKFQFKMYDNIKTIDSYICKQEKKLDKTKFLKPEDAKKEFMETYNFLRRYYD